MFVIVGALLGLSRPASALPQEEPPQLTDVRLVALTVLYEATNQPELGQRLVAHVAVNRWRDSGMSVEEVVFQEGQFLAWTDARKYNWLTCEVWNAEEECFTNLALRLLGGSPSGLDRWTTLLAMSSDVLAGEAAPLGFEGVKYFDNPDFWPDGMPPWAPYKEALGCVADHCFWR